MKKNLILLSVIGLVGLSSYATAQTTVYRFPLPGVKMSTGVSDGVGDEVSESELSAPSDFIFSESNDQLSGNTGSSGSVTVYDELGNSLGSGFSNETGDFTITFNPSLDAGKNLIIEVTDGTDTLTSTVVVPELETDVACYNPENVGKIGTYSGCMDMLIVDRAMLDTAIDNGRYAISVGGTSYTFADSQHNVFTGQVTDFYQLFQDTDFTGNISYWDTSNVTDMASVFHRSAFNGDISGWDTSKVTNMRNMFNNSSFNGDISEWNTSKVTDTQNMFYNSSFNGDISEWDMSNVISMANMFSSSVFNGDISGWDTSSVTSMHRVFDGSVFNRDISGWDTSSVTDMTWMFRNAASFNGDISGWDTSSVTDMTMMFYGAASFNGDISGWDTSSVTNMQSMFGRASSFNSNISEWDTSSVTNMDGMFFNTQAFNQDLSSWCVSKITAKPNNFDGLAASWTQPQPVWGTCP